MRWTKRIRKLVLTASAIAGVFSGTQTLAGRPIVPGGDLRVSLREHRVSGGRQLDFRLGGGTTDASVFLDVLAPAPTHSVESRFDQRPILAAERRVSPDQRHWLLWIPIPPRDSSDVGLTHWVSGEQLSIAFLGPTLESAGRLIVEDWRISTSESQDSMQLSRIRAAFWWFYLVLLLLSMVGAATAILWEETKAFTTEDVIRELIGLVEGKNPKDTILLRKYLLSMVVDEKGYQRAVERLGLTSFSKGRSVARRALIQFEEVASPLRIQLDVALGHLRVGAAKA